MMSSLTISLGSTPFWGHILLALFTPFVGVDMQSLFCLHPDRYCHLVLCWLGSAGVGAFVCPVSANGAVGMKCAPSVVAFGLHITLVSRDILFSA
jgi:hypothetical protein